MNTNKVVKSVRDLQEGDTTSSGWTVVRRPVRGTRTPSGKHEVAVRKDGYTRLATWRSDTKMAVTNSLTDSL